MTNKYIEALEKIKTAFKERGLCDYDGDEYEYDCTDCDVPVNCPYYIATQALAPQENCATDTDQVSNQVTDQVDTPQECDVDKKYLKEILEELNCDAKWAVQNIKALRKQLHSQGCDSKLSEAHQEKTFTVEEVKE